MKARNTLTFIVVILILTTTVFVTLDILYILKLLNLQFDVYNWLCKPTYVVFIVWLIIEMRINKKE